MNSLPQAGIAIIGGSGTLSMDFPAALGRKDVEIIQRDMVFDTPYGQTPPFLFFRCGDKKVLTCRMHGWRQGISRADASRQIFWLFRAAGVKKILAEGGVGSVNHLLDTRDVVIASDYIDQSMRKDVGLEGHYLLIMRQALCPHLRQTLITAAEARPLNRVFRRGVYAVTDGRHFESPAEVAMLKGQADIIGQSLCPEVYLAREIGACYAGLYTVVNYGEGVVKDWEHRELSQIFYEDADKIGHILLEAVSRMNDQQHCGCADLRKPTLLKKVYGPTL